MNLPPLPAPAVPPSELITKSGVWGSLYTAEQMQAYRKAALEEAAKVCDEAYDVFFAKHEFEVPKHRYSADSVKRSIKAGVEFVTSDCATNIRKLK